MRKEVGYGIAGNASPARYTNLMPPRSTRTINVDGVALELAIERKGVKNVNARLTGSTLSISAPCGMPQEALDEAVLKLARRLLRRAHASRVNEAHDALKLAHAVAKRFPKEPSGIPPLRRTRFAYAAVDSRILSSSKSAGLL